MAVLLFIVCGTELFSLIRLETCDFLVLELSLLVYQLLASVLAWPLPRPIFFDANLKHLMGILDSRSWKCSKDSSQYNCIAEFFHFAFVVFFKAFLPSGHLSSGNKVFIMLNQFWILLFMKFWNFSGEGPIGCRLSVVSITQTNDHFFTRFHTYHSITNICIEVCCNTKRVIV